MIIALLIVVIGIIPIVLAISVFKMYKGSDLAFVLLWYLLFISFWQLDIAVLYLKGVFSEGLLLWLFKIFRIGPTFVVPLVFYLSYILIKKHTANIKNNRFYQLLLSIINLKVLAFLIAWSIMIYVINLTSLGIVNLKVVKILNTNSYFYFPVYGPLQFLYVFHTGSFILFVILTLLISKQIQNTYLKDFLGTFYFCTFLLFVAGFLNFIPGAGALFSSLAIIIISVVIVFSFVRMHTVMTVNYNRLIERQRKLDYTGNYTASLVHEVKNTLQIIKGYSKLLSELSSLPSQGKRMNEMIEVSVQQLDELVQNYTKFINHETIDFKIVDLNEIIEQAIHISEEMMMRNSVEVAFGKNFRTLKTHANETYLKQVFFNLIKNSIEAFPKERTARKIVISTDIQADKIFINIIDTGRGIPEANWESIFDPFTSNKKDGMGLGLPFVKKVMYEHRGDIRIVKSGPEGTHIQLELPQYTFSEF